MSTDQQKNSYVFRRFFTSIPLTQDEIDRLCRGEPILRGDKMYAVCARCRKLVRVNKPFLGSLHVCVDSRDTWAT